MNKVDHMTLCLNFILGDLAIHKVFKRYIKTIDKKIVNVYNGFIGGVRQFGAEYIAGGNPAW